MDTLFGLDHTHPQNKDLKLLVTAFSQPELLVIESLLRDAEIPFLAKERGTGSSLKIIAGYSVFGTDIYVHKDQFDLASELLTAVPMPDSEETVAEEEEA